MLQHLLLHPAWSYGESTSDDLSRLTYPVMMDQDPTIQTDKTIIETEVVSHIDTDMHVPPPLQPDPVTNPVVEHSASNEVINETINEVTSDHPTINDVFETNPPMSSKAPVSKLLPRVQRRRGM